MITFAQKYKKSLENILLLPFQKDCDEYVFHVKALKDLLFVSNQMSQYFSC